MNDTLTRYSISGVSPVSTKLVEGPDGVLSSASRGLELVEMGGFFCSSSSFSFLFAAGASCSLS